MSAAIPDNLKDLLERPLIVAFATSNPDGQPQVTPVWASLEGDQVWINSAVGRRKDRNIRANPKVTVLVIDPQNGFHWAEIRGEVVAFDESEAALAHINKLSRHVRRQRRLLQLQSRRQRPGAARHLQDSADARQRHVSAQTRPCRPV